MLVSNPGVGSVVKHYGISTDATAPASDKKLGSVLVSHPQPVGHCKVLGSLRRDTYSILTFRHVIG